jgi:hypothetical protein
VLLLLAALLAAPSDKPRLAFIEGRSSPKGGAPGKPWKYVA